jgi:OOP family OmpA-OmpF porin
MKKNLLVLSLFLLFFSAANAQAIVDTTGVIGDSYNRWSIEVSVGQGKGVKPYSSNNYYSSNPD